MLADLFAAAGRRNVNTPSVSGGMRFAGSGAGPPNTEQAQKLSAVYAAIEIRSDSMSVLPAYVIDLNTRERVEHPILDLLSVRPNEAMTPSVRKKLLERSVLISGRALDWIIRDPRSQRPVELIPIPGEWVQVWLDDKRRPWYRVTLPLSGEHFWLANEDVCHYKGPSKNGYDGMSTLGFAREVISAGLAAQEHNKAFYERGGQPAGVLVTDTDLGGFVNAPDGSLTSVTLKEQMRLDWERFHSGPANAYRVAVLDNGVKYQPITVNHRDSQFIEQENITVEDIARFFSVPLYKLQSGKQSYNSNEQNAIEYMNSLQPRVTQIEEEQTYKLLMPSERNKGLEIRYNMNAMLRADNKSRAEYYRAMRDASIYSVNDVRRLEDMSDVPGGDDRRESLNYVPLSLWEALSRKRNGGETSEA